MDIFVRAEREGDFEGIGEVNGAAFGRAAEGELVAALREAGALTLSLVALADGRVVGHIAFSPGWVRGDGFEVEAVALGPMAVLPAYQGQGVGSRLVREGLEQLRAQGAGAVFVLGHPTYYPRFGFTPAQTYGVACEFEVAPEVFMVWAPDGVAPAGLEGRAGVFYYRPEFRGV